MKIRIMNQVLCFIFFLMLVYLYAPQGFGQTPPVESPPEDPALQEKIDRAVEKKLDEILPGYVEQEVNRKLPSAVTQKLKENKQKEEEQRERFLERNPDLRGHYMWGAIPVSGMEGPYGVKFDLNPGFTSSTGSGMDQSNIYYARIVPFIRVDRKKKVEHWWEAVSWGAELSLDAKYLAESSIQQNDTNIQNFLKNEIATTGELRDKITKLNFKNAYIYFVPLDIDKATIKVYAGQVPVPLISEVVNQTVFHESILDKYNLTSSLAARVDIGFGRIEGPNPTIVERQIWVQAASFNLDTNGNLQDFSARILLSLSILNHFSDMNFKPVDIWAGFGRIGSGAPTAGESVSVTDPSQVQEMMVFGLKIDLNKLTGSELGEIFTEFVHRRKTGDITDQSWVVGWSKKIKFSEEGNRPIEVAVRFQSQQDDPDVRVSDGSVLSGGILIPLVDYSVALRMNLGYVFHSTDPARDEEIIFTTDFEVLW